MMRSIVFYLSVFVLFTQHALFMYHIARNAETVSSFGYFVEASSSRSNYNPYQYDLTVPQFTPDGRLLQVEYAKMASTDHSIPIIAATIHHGDTRKSIAPQSAKEEIITILVAGRRKAEGQQSRLILLPSFSSIISSSNHHTPTGASENGAKNCIVIAISGVLADALSILQTIQSFRIQEYRSMGSTATDLPASRRIAIQIASQCQARTLAGGKRPLGATFWITTPSNYATNGLILYQTDPSGAMHDITLHENTVAALGGGDCGAAIRKRLENEWICRPNDQTLPTEHDSSHRKIGRLLNIVIEEYQKHYFRVNSNDTPSENDVDDKNGRIDNDIDRLEVVIISSTRGAIQLTPHQVRSFMQEQ
jgi:20S proteasome alpha/beta subunit